jgi:ESS family glutamate:Na+ symporter
MDSLEIITYHALALGFIASAFKTNGGRIGKKRSVEVFNTGVTTVSTYLIQGIFGLGITIIASLVISGFFAAAGVLLPFGYGQGTGQALNYGNIYYRDFGFTDGPSFGLTIAALGFLSAAIGGVVHLNVMKRRGKLIFSKRTDGSLHTDSIESDNEIPMQESIDKMTIQIALIAVAYMLAYLVMLALGKLLPSMKSVIYGFNFLLGVLSATLIKVLLNFLYRKKIIKKIRIRRKFCEFTTTGRKAQSGCNIGDSINAHSYLLFFENNRMHSYKKDNYLCQK